MAKGSATAVGIVVILVLIASSVLLGTYVVPAITNRAPKVHQAIIDETTVTAYLQSEVTAELKAVLLRTRTQKVQALDVSDILERALWYGKEVDLTEWAWEYKGQPLAYMKISGPLEDTLYIEFSKATLSKVTVQLLDQTRTFDTTFPDTQDVGFWFTFVELES